MAKTIDLGSGFTQTQRTFRTERETPSTGDYSIRVHREHITYRDGVEIARQEHLFAVNLPVPAVMGLTCTRDYLAACQGAKVPADLMAAEAAWYDALVDYVAEAAAGEGA